MSAFRRTIETVIAALAFSGVALAQDVGRETRIGEEGFESPPASLEQMDWLEGQWIGEGIDGAPAMESWLPPTGGTMVGTFVQEVVAENGASSIMFTEILYLMEEEGSLVLRLKHFNADLTGWEEKDDSLTFRLVAIEPCAVFFNALTLRCTDPERPGEGLVAAVRMRSGGELVFHFREAASLTGAVSCPEAQTTLDLNQCYADKASASEARRASYFQAALERERRIAEETAQRRDTEIADLSVFEQMQSSKAAFEAYREAECGAVWQSWRDGTIRTVMALACRIEMTDRRTHIIWENWLTYQDNSPPDLPEPGSTL